MEVLVVDTAARGHALAEKAKESPLVDNVYLWPTKVLAAETTEPTDLPTFEEFNEDWKLAIPALARFAKGRCEILTIASAERI